MNFRLTERLNLDPFDSYKLYQALKLHFESDSYDAPKYNYKTSAKPQAFFKRRDKYYFAKLAKKFPRQDQLVEYYVSQFTSGVKWVGDMLDEKGDETYLRWKKVKESIGYEFQKDISTLCTKAEVESTTFDDLLKVRDKQLPPVVTLYNRGEISLTTIVILNKLTGFLHHANRTITETIVWPDLYRKFIKTEPFVDVDLNKMKKIVVNTF